MAFGAVFLVRPGDGIESLIFFSSYVPRHMDNLLRQCTFLYPLLLHVLFPLLPTLLGRVLREALCTGWSSNFLFLP